MDYIVEKNDISFSKDIIDLKIINCPLEKEIRDWSDQLILLLL